MSKPKATKNTPADCAKGAVDPAFMATAAAETWVGAMFQELPPGPGMAVLVTEMRQVIARVKAGDTSDIEAMLTGQALALQALFTNLSRKAAQQEYIGNLQAMLGLALKTQAACRQTLEALGELKHPRTVVVAQQANVAHQQQINHRPSEVDQGRPGPKVSARVASLAHGESAVLENELIPLAAVPPKEGTPNGVG